MKDKDKIRILRCEERGCKAVLSQGIWKPGWTQIGVSRFGTKFDPEGIASWCPHHEKETLKL